MTAGISCRMMVAVASPHIIPSVTGLTDWASILADRIGCRTITPGSFLVLSGEPWPNSSFEAARAITDVTGNLAFARISLGEMGERELREVQAEAVRLKIKGLFLTFGENFNARDALSVEDALSLFGTTNQDGLVLATAVPFPSVTLSKKDAMELLAKRIANGSNLLFISPWIPHHVSKEFLEEFAKSNGALPDTVQVVNPYTLDEIHPRFCLDLSTSPDIEGVMRAIDKLTLSKQ